MIEFKTLESKGYSKKDLDLYNYFHNYESKRTKEDIEGLINDRGVIEVSTDFKGL